MEVRVKRKPWPGRFWEKVEKTDGCWLWTGAASPNGYGQIMSDGSKKLRPAHRVSWELANGPIPDGMFVCHHCDVPLCVNPAHLFIGTPADNAADMKAKGRARGPSQGRPLTTVCKRGHVRTPENTRLYHNRQNCLICHREHNQNYKARVRAAKQGG